MDITIHFSSGRTLKTTTDKIMKDSRLLSLATRNKAKMIKLIEQSADNLLNWFIHTPNMFFSADSIASDQFEIETNACFDDMKAYYNDMLEQDDLYQHLTKEVHYE